MNYSVQIILRMSSPLGRWSTELGAKSPDVPNIRGEGETATLLGVDVLLTSVFTENERRYPHSRFGTERKE